MPLVALSAAALLLSACPDPNANTDAGPPPPDEEDLGAAIADLFVRCSEWAPGTFLDEMEPELAGQVRGQVGEDLEEAFAEAFDNPNVAVDESKIADCIAWLETADCGEEPDEGTGCDGVVMWAPSRRAARASTTESA
jgi:hypothetical protein